MENIKISFENLGTINKNVVSISTNKGSIDLYFSYETLVAVNNVVSQNDWSKTTGKLLNELESDKSKRVEHKEVLEEAQRQLKKVLYTEHELIALNL